MDWILEIINMSGLQAIILTSPCQLLHGHPSSPLRISADSTAR